MGWFNKKSTTNTTTNEYLTQNVDESENIDVVGTNKSINAGNAGTVNISDPNSENFNTLSNTLSDSYSNIGDTGRQLFTSVGDTSRELFTGIGKIFGDLVNSNTLSNANNQKIALSGINSAAILNDKNNRIEQISPNLQGSGGLDTPQIIILGIAGTALVLYTLKGKRKKS